MKNKMKTHRDLSGFTLLELICVISIISILFGVVVFGMDGFTASQRLKTDARNLAAFVEAARNQAIMENRRIYLSYDMQHNICYCADQPGETTDNINSDHRYVLQKKITLKEVRFGDNRPESNGVFQICISSLGDIESHDIVLEGENEIMEIKINGILGTTKILSLNLE